MSDKNYCYVDFEFHSSEDENPHLVSVAFTVSSSGQSYVYWLEDSDEKRRAIDTLIDFSRDHTFVAWAVTAEARCFMALGISPTRCKWIDLYLEYRCLTNHNHKMMYGKQLIDGRLKTTYPPKNKWDMTEEDKKRFNFSKPQHSLASATFKLIGKKIDTDFKDRVRDIILSKDADLIEENKDEIMRYNESDIHYLPLLKDAIVAEYKRLTVHAKSLRKNLKEEMLKRGEYAARTAIMESIGYPIDYVATKSFSDSVATIIWEVQDEINGLFPEIMPFTKQKNGTYTWSHVRTKEWIASQKYKKWIKTEKKSLSLSLEAFQKYFTFKHHYPKDNFGAQMVRYLTLKQNLNGFSPTSKNSFWEYVGSDKRVRPYFGIYGSQSARSQPKATGFLFLKSAWMRSLCSPPKGRAICGIDYKSQEFLLAALLSRDKNMLEAYQSGDPYLYLAKLAGAVPKDGTKEEYSEERDLFKSTTLGISYGMTKFGLSIKLSNDMGRLVSEEEAQELIDKFNKAYNTYYLWSKRIYSQYRRDGYLQLPCGWIMWGDNENRRSVCNFPIQGFGSSIMRKAVSLAQNRGLRVILTLHDAIYIEYDSGSYSPISTLAECMDEAFRFYFNSDIRGDASVGLDANIWSQDYSDGYEEVGGLKVKQQKVYLDGRGAKEYEMFKQYFEQQEFNL